MKLVHQDNKLFSSIKQEPQASYEYLRFGREVYKRSCCDDLTESPKENLPCYYLILNITPSAMIINTVKYHGKRGTRRQMNTYTKQEKAYLIQTRTA